MPPTTRKCVVCGAHPPKGRNTCSEACRQKCFIVGRTDERRRKRREQKAYRYKRRDKADVVARLTEAQAGLCFICKRADPLVLDHCHTTGEPRSMLCVRCNTALGSVREDPAIARSLVEYCELCVTQ